MTRLRRFGSALGELLFTVAAAVGVLCILATVAALLAGISLIMFSTGSMSPTIPTGSVAVVRAIPAAQVRVGDVVTVERSGRLPVTHRVREVAPGPGEVRVLTLRGDANDADDLEPYRVTSVRIVLFSVPGLAPLIVGLGHPFVLGGLTLAATCLVLWAFWPRRPRPSPSADGAAAVRSVVVVLVVLVGVGTVLLTASPAQAEVRERVIRGRVITLIAVGDAGAMTNLAPGEPVTWQVGVTSNPPEPGQIDLTLSVEGGLAEDALQLRVDSCPRRWRDDRCDAGTSPVLRAGAAARYLGRATDAGRLRAGDERWLLVTAWLPSGAAGGRGTATVTLTATGFDDRVATGPGELPQTGTSASRGVLLAGVLAIGLGGALALRRRADR